MPIIRKLAPEEVAQRNAPKASKRQQVAQEYDAMIAGFAPGDWGEVSLADDDNRLTVRNRLQAAAQRHQVSLSFHRTTGNLMRFEVAESQATPPVEEKPAGKKRGRPPRVAA